MTMRILAVDDIPGEWEDALLPMLSTQLRLLNSDCKVNISAISRLSMHDDPTFQLDVLSDEEFRKNMPDSAKYDCILFDVSLRGDRDTQGIDLAANYMEVKNYPPDKILFISNKNLDHITIVEKLDPLEFRHNVRKFLYYGKNSMDKVAMYINSLVCSCSTRYLLNPGLSKLFIEGQGSLYGLVHNIKPINKFDDLLLYNNVPELKLWIEIDAEYGIDRLRRGIPENTEIEFNKECMSGFSEPSKKKRLLAEAKKPEYCLNIIDTMLNEVAIQSDWQINDILFPRVILDASKENNIFRIYLSKSIDSRGCFLEVSNESDNMLTVTPYSQDVFQYRFQGSTKAVCPVSFFELFATNFLKDIINHGNTRELKAKVNYIAEKYAILNIWHTGKRYEDESQIVTSCSPELFKSVLNSCYVFVFAQLKNEEKVIFEVTPVKTRKLSRPEIFIGHSILDYENVTGNTMYTFIFPTVPPRAESGQIRG